MQKKKIKHDQTKYCALNLIQHIMPELEYWNISFVKQIDIVPCHALELSSASWLCKESWWMISASVSLKWWRKNRDSPWVPDIVPSWMLLTTYLRFWVTGVTMWLVFNMPIFNIWDKHFFNTQWDRKLNVSCVFSVFPAAAAGSCVSRRWSSGTSRGHREWATGLSGRITVRRAACTSWETSRRHVEPSTRCNYERCEGESPDLL